MGERVRRGLDKRKNLDIMHEQSMNVIETDILVALIFSVKIKASYHHRSPELQRLCDKTSPVANKLKNQPNTRTQKHLSQTLYNKAQRYYYHFPVYCKIYKSSINN